MTREEEIIQASDEWTYQKPPQYSELVHKTRKVMCAYQVGFIDGAVWADAHPNWISVEDDGNPIDTGWYIFTTGKIVDVGYYLGGNEWRDVHPTHWMPLPSIENLKKGGEE